MDEYLEEELEDSEVNPHLNIDGPIRDPICKTRIFYQKRKTYVEKPIGLSRKGIFLVATIFPLFKTLVMFIFSRWEFGRFVLGVSSLFVMGLGID